MRQIIHLFAFAGFATALISRPWSSIESHKQLFRKENLQSVANKPEVPSFAPDDFPISTRENDGTLVGRYDVRQTQAIVQDQYQAGLNNWFYLLWITTVDGRKYHLTTSTGLLASGDAGYHIAGFLGLEDLSNLTHVGKVLMEPGSASTEFLNLRSPSQNVSSPHGSDNYTDMYFSGDFGGVAANLHLQPTGPNYYAGGSGYVTLRPTGPVDYFFAPPGYSWYWGNPNLRVSGTIRLDGQDVEIDSSRSKGLLERQWGQMELRDWYLHWIYLSNGVFLHVWINEPTIKGFNPEDVSFATAWYPDGAHEFLQVGNTTRAWDTTRSPKTGNLYFNEFQLDIPTRNASIRISKLLRETVMVPDVPGPVLNVSEAFSQGSGTWNGQPVEVFGHTEQISTIV